MGLKGHSFKSVLGMFVIWYKGLVYILHYIKDEFNKHKFQHSFAKVSELQGSILLVCEGLMI